MEHLDIFSLANFGLNLVEKKSSNLKCAEIFFNKNKYINIEVEENSLKNSETGEDIGVSIRVINNKGSLGFAFTNRLDKKSIEFIVKLAIKMMNVGTPNPDFINLPSKFKKYPDVKQLFDDDLKNLPLEDSLGYAKELIKICADDDLAISQSANFSSSYVKTYIFNSNNLVISGKETNCTLYSEIIIKDKVTKEMSSGSDFQSERMLKNINVKMIGRKALNDAKKNLNRIKIKSMKCPLILTPRGTISLILKPIAAAVNGETFQYKRCFLFDKRDEILGSEYLNIEDNGLIDGAVGSSKFDGEGVPCKNKKIFQKGKFLKNGLLHNSFTAGKEGVESTGNASRNSYSSIPSIGITNFIMKQGDISFEEIVKDTKKGIILDYTGDSPNISTGDFSGLILHGNLIEDGQVKQALNETMIGINLLDLFKKIEMVSKQYRVYGSLQAPYVKIETASIVGGAN
ncbi:MAG: TldD/PmbA family protein [Candidatus Hermodarchaeota archaeon]